MLSSLGLTGIQAPPVPAQPGPTVHFKFNNDADMAFYILNAVCHDWIHDFNNYGRMGVILKYIDHLVNPKPESTSTASSSSASAVPPTRTNRPPVLDLTKLPIEGGPGSLMTPGSSRMPGSAGGGNTGGSGNGPTDMIVSVQNEETRNPKFATAWPEDLHDVLSRLSSEQPGALSLTAVSAPVAQVQNDNKTNMNVDDENEGSQLVTAVRTNPPTPTPISIDQGVLNAIDSYIQIKTNYEEPDNRFVLQLLEEFIGECKLLVISKLTSDPPPKPPSNLLEDTQPDTQPNTQPNESQISVIPESQINIQADFDSLYRSTTVMNALDSLQNTSMDVDPDKPKGIYCVTKEDILSAIENITKEIKGDYTNPVDGDWTAFIQKITDEPSAEPMAIDDESVDGEEAPKPKRQRTGSHDKNNKTTTMIDPEYKTKLLNLFSFLSKVFVKIKFNPAEGNPSISPLEKLNNSLISDILGSFIIGKDLKDHEQNIDKISNLFVQNMDRLNILVPEETKTIDDIGFGKKQEEINDDELGGGGIFSKKLYESNNKALWAKLDTAITDIKGSILYQIYTGTAPSPETTSTGLDDRLVELDDAYKIILDPENPDNTDLQTAIQIICGVGLKNSKMNMIENRRKSADSDKLRIKTRNVQILADSIVSFVFDDIIKPYEDIKARVQLEADTAPDGSSMTPQQRKCVQKISQLVAKKTLDMSGLKDIKKYTDSTASASTAASTASSTASNSISDLEAQRIIIDEVANDRGYGAVDNKLIEYFNRIYRGGNFIDNGQLKNLIVACKRNGDCRIINNAIQEKDIKREIDGYVSCPTSSVCDGMGSFGSCFPPKNKEYYNMDFMISSPEDGDRFYEGKTTLTAKKDSVAIEYGFKFNDLQLYNFLKIDITSKPIVLEANYAFKGVINRILEIWKAAEKETNIEGLWGLLENDAFFLSVLQVGSQKAIGDIFQEVNSTLKRGGYANDVNLPQPLVDKKTFGLMGDRPSGVRVVKLLKDGNVDDININACGGYVSDQGSLIYYNITKKDSAVMGGPGRGGPGTGRQGRGGPGGGMTQKKFKTKTNTRKKKNNKRRTSIKKSKKNNKNTRRFAN